MSRFAASISAVMPEAHIHPFFVLAAVNKGALQGGQPMLKNVPPLHGPQWDLMVSGQGFARQVAPTALAANLGSRLMVEPVDCLASACP